MATINVNKKSNTEGSSKQPEKAPLFRKMNYILMGIGIVILLIGFLCMRGGAVDDPTVFNGEIFNNTRIVVAPILMFVGLVMEVVAIMWHPRSKKAAEENSAE